MATEAQRAKFRRYFNDPGTVFSNDEIDAIWTDAESAASSTEENVILVEARIIGIDMLRMDASKLGKYTQNESDEDRTEVFKALTQMRKELVAERDRQEGSAAQVLVRMAATKRSPKQDKQYPR